MGFRRRKSFRRKSKFRRRGGRTFVKKVKRVIQSQAEKKYIDVAADNTSFQSGVDQLIINPLPLGTGAQTSQRLGNKIFLRWIRVKLFLQSNGINDIAYRVAVVQARSNGFLNSDFPSLPWNLFDQERFIVYKDVDGVLNATPNGTPNRYLNVWVRVMKKMTFDSAASTIPFLPYYITICCNDSTLPSPIANYAIRSYFTDV